MKSAVKTTACVALLLLSMLCVSQSPGIVAADHTYAKQHTAEIVFGDEEDGTPRGDQPEVVIEAPSSVKVGDMIVVDLSKSIGTGFDLIIQPTPPQVRVFNEGKIIVTASGYKSTEYLFIASCALNGQSDVKTHTVRVIGGEPLEPLDPGDNLVQKVLSWCETVDSPTPRDDALKLAQSFSSLAFNTAAEIVAATKTSNRDALGANLQFWLPLLDGLMNELKAMASVGLLPDPMAHGPIWSAVSEGLEAYAQQLTE